MLSNKDYFGPTALVATIVLLLAVNSVTPTVNYQYRQYHPQYQPQQPQPYFFPTQKYIAVPGRIVQHANEVAISHISVPFQQLPLLRNYYELETESSSSPPAEGDDAFGPDLPMNPSPSPPPDENENEPESEEPPMNPPPPPPPPPENNDDDFMEMKPSHPHSKIVHRHVSIHVPPKEFDEEEDDDQVTIIRPKIPKPDKHVNIIFIKAPTPATHRGKTEVILPDTPEQKTLVYILVKKPDPSDGIRVRGPPPTEPPKPQVFFIRYKHNKKEGYHHHH